MSSYELTFSPERPNRNLKTGRFMPGAKPHNKGKRWDEYMSPRGQETAKIGWENLKCEHKRSPLSGKTPTPIIAIVRERPVFFPTIEAAARRIEGLPQSVHRCAHDNRARTINRRNGSINTDHRYKGVRFYYESDEQWTEKISK